MLTPMAIRYVVYDLLRAGKSDEEITQALQDRGATYADLVAFIIGEI